MRSRVPVVLALSILLPTAMAAQPAAQPVSPVVGQHVSKLEIHDVKGFHSSVESRYTITGTYAIGSDWNYEGPYDPNKVKWSASYDWKAEGRYEPRTKATTEKVDLYSIDARSHAGSLISSMVCNRDPWREAGQCQYVVTQTTGNPPVALLHDLNAAARGVPFSSILNPSQRAALNQEYPTRFLVGDRPPQQREQFAVNAPRVAAPAPGSQYRAQSPLAIRLTPPSGTKPQSYLLRVEKKNAAGGWELVTNLPASASEAESATGYTGFGAHKPGTPANMQATPGAWRVSAQVTSPTPSKWSTPNEFTVVAADSPRLMTDPVQPARRPAADASRLKVR
jgi:hypothetical protein